MSANNGGPAFPNEGGIKFALGNDLRKTLPSTGMTLRDYFAAKAMQGICAHHDTWGLNVQEIASRSYEVADAMLLERAK